MTSQALTEAIQLAGSEEKLGKAIGYSQHAIWKAKTLGRVSGDMAIKIFVWSDGAITLQRLCPDLFKGEEADAMPLGPIEPEAQVSP